MARQPLEVVYQGETYTRCSRCKRYLLAVEFSKCRSRPNGLHAYCLECNRKMQAAERARRGEEYREMRRRYRASEKGRRAYARYVPAHPWQKWAQTQVWLEIAAGRMVKPDTCSECGRGGLIDGHHDDYAKPLEVRWLCRWCHREWHRLHGEAANANESVLPPDFQIEELAADWKVTSTGGAAHWAPGKTDRAICGVRISRGREVSRSFLKCRRCASAAENTIRE